MTSLNQRELDILNVLWGTDEPMTSTDICEAKRGLTQSTVIAVLRKLLQDGLVENVGVTHSGKVLSRTYRPTEESKEAIKSSFMYSYVHFRDIISKSEICNIILGVEQKPEQFKKEIEKIKKLIATYEQKWA